VQNWSTQYGIPLLVDGKLNPEWHIEHIIPKTRGGPDHPSNYCLMYGPINSSFGNLCTHAKEQFIGEHIAREVAKAFPIKWFFAYIAHRCFCPSNSLIDKVNDSWVQWPEKLQREFQSSDVLPILLSVLIALLGLTKPMICGYNGIF